MRRSFERQLTVNGPCNLTYTRSPTASVIPPVPWARRGDSYTRLSPMSSILYVVATCCLLFLVRIVQLLTNIHRARRDHRSVLTNRHHVPIRTLVVLGSGGHTTEMLTLVDALDPSSFSPLLFCKASSDTTSQQRLATLRHTPAVHNIPRAREVGQSYWTSLWTTLVAQVHAIRLVYRLRPRLLLCNGPGTCLPVCCAALMLRCLRVLHVETVYCESLCRVQSLSMTGKLLYHVTDVFLVHWPELQKKYPKSQRVRVFVTEEEEDGLGE